MRAFAAITAPEEIRLLYSKLCRGMREGAEMSVVRPEKMHVTLAFFPELKPEEAEKARSCLTALKFEPFEIRCSGLGRFRRRGLTSVIYVEIKSEKLASFAAAFRKNLKKADVYFKDKPFRAHLTLARIREIKDEDLFERMFRGISRNFRESTFTASSVTLFSSDTLTYKEIFREDFPRIESHAWEADE